MSLASLSGVAVTRARVQVPCWGLPWADVELEEDETLTGSVTLTFGDVTYAMTVVSGGPYNGRAAYRLVGGAGGWGKDAPAKAHHDDAGVKVSSVLTDVAAYVGETLVSAPTTRLGPHFARLAGPAYQVLNGLAPRAWYVDTDGSTRFGARPTAVYSGDAARVRTDPAMGIYELATEEVAAMVPGVTIDGSLPATDVEYAIDDRRLTVRVWTGRRTTRRLDAIRRILDAIDPWRLYRGTFEFRVVTQDSERLNLQPVRTASGMPSLARVPVRPGMAGLKATVLPGELVLVVFADGDPSRPQVVAHDAPDAPGWMPLFLKLGAEPTLGVARQTDPVVAGPFAGTITLGSARIKAGS